MVKVPATDEGLPAIRGADRPRHFHQHHAVVLAGSLSPGGGGLSGAVWKNMSARAAIPPTSRASPASSSAASTARLTSSWMRRWRKPTIRPRKSGSPTLMGQVAIANAKMAYQDYKKLFSGARWEKLAAKGAKAAAAAVGVDRHQEQGIFRRSLCRGIDRPQHGQYRAAGDARCVPRSRQGARLPWKRMSRTPPACWRRLERNRHLARRDHGRARHRRRKTVRGRGRQALWRGRLQARDHHSVAGIDCTEACARRRARQDRCKEQPSNGAASAKIRKLWAEGQVGLDRRQTRTNGWAGSTAPAAARYRRLRGTMHSA